MPSELEFEIDQNDPTLIEEFAQYLVDLERLRVDYFEFLRGRPSERNRMLTKNQRIVELIGFVVVLDDRMFQRLPLFPPQPADHRPPAHISHHRFARCVPPA